MERDTLEEKLRRWAEHGRAPFHMPGHKRRALHSPGLPWVLDVTEIEGFDDLHDPEGVLAQGMAAAAALWGSDEAYYLVNGSTGGLLAALHAALPRRSPLLVARNCHKSVYHALELLELEPTYLQPPVDGSSGVAGSVSPSAVAAALAEHPEARALVLTSPTYDGVLSDIPSLCALCHGHGIPLIVDEAHGAHMGFSPFPDGAVKAGADLVVQSLHKTLPSLTQTALLHRTGDRVPPVALRRSLGLFQTSSPSYPLMASLDGCVRFLARHTEVFRDWWDALDGFDRAISGLSLLRVLCHGDSSLPPAFFGFDPSKLVISTHAAALTGPELARRLRRDYHMEPEMVAPHSVNAMTGLGDTRESLLALADALVAIDAALLFEDPCAVHTAPPLPRRFLPAGAALERPHAVLPLPEAVGRVAGEYLWAYPPGIPLLVPGEEVPDWLPDLCAGYENAGLGLKHTGATAPGALRVCL